MTHILLAGGGTAGHVEPALAVADAIRRRHPDIGVTFLGTAAGLECSLVPARGYELALIARVPLPRRLSMDLLTLPFRMLKAVRQVRSIMKRNQVTAVVGFGGYVALPAYLAARGRVPIIIHEANAKPGLANKLGARWASVIAEAAPGSIQNARHIGVPLRRTIAAAKTMSKEQARQGFGLDADTTTVLVIGGSQGARRINQALIAAAPALLDSGVQVLHAVGPLNQDDLGALSQWGPRYRAVPYIDDMASAYASADLIICRSGAMTCAEVAAMGIPAMFVPYPVGNGEQRLNAAPLVRAGGAVLINDAELTADVVVQWVASLVKDPARRADMSKAMAALGMRDADDRMVDVIEQAMGVAR